MQLVFDSNKTVQITHVSNNVHFYFPSCTSAAKLGILKTAGVLGTKNRISKSVLFTNTSTN